MPMERWTQPGVVVGEQRGHLGQSPDGETARVPPNSHERTSTLAPRPSRRSVSPSASRKGRCKTSVATVAAQISDPDGNEITKTAARLGITAERVLQEYARIAFADLRRLADWGPDGLVPKKPEFLTDADAAAISEITTVGAATRHHRIKLYDKKAALDAIARHLGMSVTAARHQESDTPEDLAEDARDALARRLARLSAAGAEG
jgi:hypothetical protein